jgi:hypothetical protein
MENKKIKKTDIILEQTSVACPEQYNACYNGRAIGYLRLRHGVFYANYNGKTVYMTSTIGDGIFDSDERDEHLNKAKKKIAKAYNKEHALT